MQANNPFDLDTIRGGVIGLAVGDAFGMPYECCRRGAYDIHADTLLQDGSHGIPGFRPNLPSSYYEKKPPGNFFGQPMPPGIWTDDTAMTLAEMESMARLRRVDFGDIMRNFCRWNDEGAFSATGAAIGQGKRTRRALERFKEGMPAVECGGTGERDNSDGSLMRMLPFVFAERLMARDGVTIDQLSAMTHAHPIAIRACRLYCEIARRIARGAEKDECVRGLSEQEPPFERLAGVALLPEDDVRSSAHVVDALEAALWSFLTTDSYEACVLRAVGLGGDTDTIAAIAGGLAGMHYGEDAIPARWRRCLFRLDEIEALCEHFSESLYAI